MRWKVCAMIGIFSCIAGTLVPQSLAESSYDQWTRGPLKDANYFPIGVWLQDPKNATRYKEVGVNFYLALWRGPTQEQLDALTAAGMSVICAQNRVGLANIENPTIIGWMHGDEPDNAQALPDDKGWGPPIPPTKIIEDYRRWREADPSRPILLNLGQGVANDRWVGRGEWGKKEDYLGYVQGTDIVSYDIYPVAEHEQKHLTGNLWYVPLGVDRLREWSKDEKIVWNVIEASPIGNLSRKVSARELRAEVWMSLIHGSKGIVYFAHKFRPNFVEAELLEDPEIREAVVKVNREVLGLAPVLNGATLPDAATVESSSPGVPIDLMAKRRDGELYLFAAAMRQEAATGKFRISGLSGCVAVEVLGEGRVFDCIDGQFSDAFEPYAVHLYRITP